MDEIFAFDDYRKYLLARIESLPNRGRGFRANLAKSIHAPISHVSQVLSGVSNFSSEQAEEVNDFLNHAGDEAHYFTLLVQFTRAGTPKLRARIDEQLKLLREKRLNLKHRFKAKETVNRDDQLRFYSSWLYAATHILLTIPRYQTREQVERYFGLTKERAQDILEFLVKVGLVENRNSRYVPSEIRVHLGSDSEILSRHHINWRIRGIQSLENHGLENQLHYSSVVSISAEDALKIKASLIKAIEGAKETIRKSPEEKLFSFCLDFFEMGDQ